MNRFSGLLAIVVLTGCSQLTTNDQELAGLQSAAARSGDAYVNCVVGAGTGMVNSSNVDVATAVTMAANQCKAQLDKYTAAQDDYLSATVMVTGKKLQESIDALNENATQQIGAQLLAAGNQQSTVAPAVAAGAATAAAAQTPAAPPATSPDTNWNADQRVYLDCMEDQAMKYAGLNESATTIADVAQSRCKSYMGGMNAALEGDGRALVLGTVMDARLGAARPRGQARPQ